MKLTTQSQQLMSSMMENECIPIQVKTKTLHHQSLLTKQVCLQYYHDLQEAAAKTTQIPITNKSSKQITQRSDIIKSHTFHDMAFPDGVISHIDTHSKLEKTYLFSLFDKPIKVHFILEEDIKNEIMEQYIQAIQMWLLMVHKYASKECFDELIILFYFTSLKKTLPDDDHNPNNPHNPHNHTSPIILNRIHINTAFTTSCPKKAEIIVFRKEEWFKVFLHESFHTFGLDFSSMDTKVCDQAILSIFQVPIEDPRLYESYCEFWAEITNAMFCSYFAMKKTKETKHNKDSTTFLKYTTYFIQFERNYSLLQLVKALNYMNLTYENLFSLTFKDKTKREALYKEKTSVLSYYVIKTILMNYYEAFIHWCHVNNTNNRSNTSNTNKHNVLSLLQFKNTTTNLKSFCEFIQQHYRTNEMLTNVKSAEECYKTLLLTKRNKNVNEEDLTLLLKNLRMTICELG